MRKILSVLGTMGLVFAVACADSESTSPSQVNGALAVEGARQITVMTRNMYLGAGHEFVKAALMNADQSDDLAAVEAAYQTLVETDYYTRVEAVVGEIAAKRPAVVGLQEVSQVDIELANSYDVRMGIHGDFMVELEEAIAERELPYVVASKVQNWVAQPFYGVKLADFDVVLVDPTQVTVTATFAHTFQNNLGDFGGLRQFRGWTGIEATYEGQTFAFVTTQLEEGDAYAHLRAEQAAQLVTALANRPRVFLMADLNDVPGSNAYRRIGEAGFRDAWRDIKGENPGYTASMPLDLANERPQLTERIDFVFAKGIALPGEKLVGDVFLTGIGKGDRIEGPMHLIWASDHAGVLARLRIPVLNDE
jgi:endonuclease/exonuclease/phosphatase family metal-dependent hydrolase